VANPLRTGWAILKALPAMARMSGQVTDVSEQVRALTELAQRPNNGGSLAMPLPRDPRWAGTPFGPNQPVVPAPISALRPDTGRPEPWIYQYPVGWNLPGSQHRLHPWQLLRQAADGISLFRRCIEIRKDHMTGLDWAVSITQDAVEAAEKGDSSGRAKVEEQLRDRLGPEIDRATAFLETPDRANGYQFAQWLSMLLEEVFVLDAAVVYPRYTYGQDLWSLEVIDGSTVKPLLDERGGRPLAPYPAYQQVLHGFPRGEFTADVTINPTTGEQVINGGYGADQIIYSRRVVRVWTPYGYSAVEQALDDGDLYLKRHVWMKSEYSQGTSIAGLYETPATLQWTPEQLLEYERAWNDALSGQTMERHQARFLPPGVTRADGGSPDALAEKYKPEYDLHLIKLGASHFDTTLPELGFTEAKGLGSDGYHEGQADVQQRKTRPIIRYVQSLITWILRNHLDMSAQLEFKFLGLDDEDDPAADEVESKRQGTAVVTLNERRDALGLPRYDFPEANMPMIITQRGVVFLEGASELGAPGTVIGPAQPVQEQTEIGPDRQPVEEDAPAPGQPGKPPAKPAPDDAQKTAELAAYRRWVRKAKSGARPFRFEHLDKTAAVAAGVDPGRAEFAKASDAGPKVPSGRTWPGWDKDLEVAQHYAPLLSQASNGAIPVRSLAQRWLAARKAASDDPGYHDALAWLIHQDYDLTGALEDVLRLVYTEGFLIGDQAAASLFLSAATGVDWGTWTPGDWKAAEKILGADGRGAGLAALLDQAGVTIQSIATNRLSALAEPLAQAVAEGWSVDKLTAALSDVLDDPRWADMVALTETNRAVSAATLQRYTDNGVPAKEWLTALDDRVCRICSINQDDGPISLSAYFSSGDDAPPGHPNCRCALGPAWDVSTTATTADGPELLANFNSDAAIIQRQVATGIASSTRLGGGVTGDVARVVTNDGATLVRKITKELDEDLTAIRQQDSEVLGALAARTLGLDSPGMWRAAEAEIYMAFADGQIAELLPDGGAAALSTDEGTRLKLLDLLISNRDRNTGNWLLGDDGTIKPIDHGLAFQQWSAPDAVPAWPDEMLGPFARWDPDTHTGQWLDNPLTSDDIATLQNRFGALRPAFEALDRGIWLDDLLARLNTLGGYATGTDGLIR
jgi:SPP1 gp7 family putative phage head morphogenesis protein